MRQKNPNNEARLALLQAWLNSTFPSIGERGVQKAFIDLCAKRGKKISQPELSSILGGVKSFGEAKAKAYEQAAGMQPGTLNPELQSNVEKTRSRGPIPPALQHEFDIIALQAVMQSMVTAMVGNIPASAAPFVEHLDEQLLQIQRDTPGFSDEKGILAAAKNIALPNPQIAARARRA